MRWLTTGIVLVALRIHAATGPGIQFIENKNQWPSSVSYSARIPGGRMNLEPGRFVYCFADERKLSDAHLHTHEGDESPGLPNDYVDVNAVFVDFEGSNSSSVPLPFGKSSTYYNYFIGTDPCRWASRAYAYQGVYYQDFYRDIDLKVYSEGNHAKYDFLVAPGGNPGQIVFVYRGADGIEINQGDLIVSTALATIIEKAPVAYQFINGKKIFVKCRYRVDGDRVSFEFPDGYDNCYELTIDPLLIFSTYSGSTADNWGSTATPGEHGTLYSSGITRFVSGTFFPATPGAFQTSSGGFYDVSILKYDSTGTNLLYASYLGGAAAETSHSLIMNAHEELIILGTTSSNDFPTTNNAFDRTFSVGDTVNSIFLFQQGSNIFLSKINKDGSSLLASTYVAGLASDTTTNDGQNRRGQPLTKNYGDQMRGDVITDASGSIYVSSMTESTDFPTKDGFDASFNGGNTDAVVFKMNASLTEMTWGTFLGGSGDDAAYSIKFDSQGNVLVAGGTTSTNFPRTAGAYQISKGGGVDGWIAKLSPDGKNILQATYTGTTAYDQIYFLDLDVNNNVFVYGQTEGKFPVSPGVYHNPGSSQFIQKFNPDLSATIFSTVFGSGEPIPNISPTAFAVNECNYIYLAGWGGGENIRRAYVANGVENMPITSDALQPTTARGADFYFLVLDSNAKDLLYATYMGGSTSFTHVDGGTSRFDKSGVVYHAVCASCGGSSDFPTTPGAWSRENKSSNCNNAAFKFDLSLLDARIRSNSIDLTSPGLAIVCIPDGFAFENQSYGGETFEWNLGDGTTFTRDESSTVESHYYETPGSYMVTMRAVDRGTCIGEDADTIIVKVFEREAEIPDDSVICEGTELSMEAKGGASYEWRANGEVISTEPKVIVSPPDTTDYIIKVTEVLGCSYLDTVRVDVIDLIAPEFELGRKSGCDGALPIIDVENTTTGILPSDILYFDLGDGVTSDQTFLVHDYKEHGVYTVKLIGVREFCVSEKVETVPVYGLTFPNVMTPGILDGKNDVLKIRFGTEGQLTPTDFGYPVAIKIFNRWGEKIMESDDYKHDWSAIDLSSGVYYYEATVKDHVTCRTWLHVVKGE